MMKKVIALSLFAGGSMLTFSAHAADEGVYARAAIGQSRTTLDTSNTMHATFITGERTRQFGLELGLGYRFNPYLGAEISYVDFGTASYDLTRGSTGETSVMRVHNQGVVTALRGFYPATDRLTLTGRAGAIFVHTSLDRQSASADDAYTGKDQQLHATYGLGIMYQLTEQLHLTADLNWYPRITKTNDNATDTNASMMTVGLQYRF